MTTLWTRIPLLSVPHSWVYVPEEFSDKSVDMYKDIIHSIVWDSGKWKATRESVTEE